MMVIHDSYHIISLCLSIHSSIHPFIYSFIHSLLLSNTYQGVENGRVFIEEITANSHQHQHGLKARQEHRETELQLLTQRSYRLLILAVESKLNGVECGADILELGFQQE